jgi:hypothetical protein
MAFGCGPSSQEQQLEAQQASMAQLLQQDYTSRFAQQTEALKNLNTALSPMIAAGPNQQGFSPAELAARTTNAIDTTAGNFRNAKQEAQTTLAGQGGGGTSGLASGIDKQIEGSIASEGAGQLSQEENEIARENYATGRQNFWQAETGGMALSGQYNPLGFSSAESGANTGAFQEAETINQQNSQGWADIGGAILGGAKVASSFFPKSGVGGGKSGG